MSLRWRLLAAVGVLAATAVTIAALSRGGEDTVEVPVVAAVHQWPEGHPPGEHSVIKMPADLAVFFVHPSGLVGTVTTIDVPEGTLVSPKMLRVSRSGDDARATALMRFAVSDEMWPEPGPAAGSRAVFSSSPGGCAAAMVTLVAVADTGAATSVTVEADPELAGLLSDEQWWIWESPPGKWPQCEREPTNGSALVESQSEVAH